MASITKTRSGKYYCQIRRKGCKPLNKTFPNIPPVEPPSFCKSNFVLKHTDCIEFFISSSLVTP